MKDYFNVRDESDKLNVIFKKYIVSIEYVNESNCIIYLSNVIKPKIYVKGYDLEKIMNLIEHDKLL
jgi:hypothetical protein